MTNGCPHISLPDRLPSLTFQRGEQSRAIVTLQDPRGREWTGLYHENFYFPALVTVWSKINAENGIQPGDHLVFSVANASLNKYKFDIVRNQAGN